MKQICVVTGGTGGIGSASVRHMLSTGYKVLFADISEEKSAAFKQQLVQEGFAAEDIEYMVCDVSDRAQCDALAAKAASMGKVQGLIHLAGLTPAFASYDAVIRVECLGTLNINEAFYKVMEEGSSIMDISSQVAHIIPFDRYPTDLFAKAFSDRQAFFTEMCGFIRNVAEQVGGEPMRSGLAYTYARCFVYWLCKNSNYVFGRKKGIRINTVSIGFCETPQSKKDLEALGGTYEERLAPMISYTALNRAGSMEEVARVFEFLIDEKASAFITGVDLLFDGGMLANGYTGRGVFDPATRPYDPEKEFVVDNTVI